MLDAAGTGLVSAASPDCLTFVTCAACGLELICEENRVHTDVLSSRS